MKNRHFELDILLDLSDTEKIEEINVEVKDFWTKNSFG